MSDKALQERLDTLTAETEAKAQFVPGLLKCPKCQFVLQTTVLNVTTGTAQAGDSSEPCPNCNVTMWRVTYKQEYQTMQQVVDRYADLWEAADDRAKALQERLDKSESRPVCRCCEQVESIENERLEAENAALKDEREALIAGFKLAADAVGYDGDWFDSAPIRMLIEKIETLREQVRWRKWPDEVPDPAALIAVQWPYWRPIDPPAQTELDDDVRIALAKNRWDLYDDAQTGD